MVLFKRFIQRLRNQFAYSVLVGVFSGCAFGPFTVHETGTTVGKGAFDLQGGYGTTGYVLKGTYGIGDDFDVGFHAEPINTSARVKYSFFNQREAGFSLATAYAYGLSLGVTHTFDLLLSYRHGRFEPYVVLRYNDVTDAALLEGADAQQGVLTGEIISALNQERNRQYGQLAVGSRLWIDESIFGIVEVGQFYISGVSSNPFLSASFGNRF